MLFQASDCIASADIQNKWYDQVQGRGTIHSSQWEGLHAPTIIFPYKVACFCFLVFEVGIELQKPKKKAVETVLPSLFKICGCELILSMISYVRKLLWLCILIIGIHGGNVYILLYIPDQHGQFCSDVIV